MPTSVSQLTQIISDATGVPLSRCKQVSRRLLESNLLPRSNGAHLAWVSNVDAIVLLLGVLAQTEVHAVPGIAEQLFDLRDPTTHRTLGSTLAELLMQIRVLDEGAPVALDGEVIVDAFTPRVLVRLNVSGQPVEALFAAPGVDELSAEDVRQLAVVPTIVLGKIARGLMRNERKAAATAA